MFRRSMPPASRTLGALAISCWVFPSYIFLPLSRFVTSACRYRTSRCKSVPRHALQCAGLDEGMFFRIIGRCEHAPHQARNIANALRHSRHRSFDPFIIYPMQNTTSMPGLRALLNRTRSWLKHHTRNFRRSDFWPGWALKQAAIVLAAWALPAIAGVIVTDWLGSHRSVKYLQTAI